MERNVLGLLAEALEPELTRLHANRFGLGEKHDASGTVTNQMFHGPGGLLTYPGVDPAVFHTIVGNKGILGELPTSPSVYTNPTFWTITGIRADVGSEKSGVCDNAPTAGLTKGCLATSVFGRYERATKEFEINSIGQRVDRADPMDLRMIGSPIAQSGIFASGAMSPATPADILRSQMAKLFWERNVSIHRLLSDQIWTGNPTNNAAAGGYKEMTGIQLLVNTGYVDAETNTSCPSMDSDLKNFAYARVDATGSGALLIDALSYLYMTRKSLAERTGVMPVRWVFVMREELFWEITKIWPCSYLTYMCQLTGQQQVVVNAADQVAMRDDLRKNKYLIINGDRIEVILDDGIPYTTNTDNANVTSGCAASDIYMLPMSIVGGVSTLFMEYFDYGNPEIGAALGTGLVLGRVEGAFLTWPRQLNTCVVFQSKVEPRLILRTPWLAGRLQNIVYCPTQFIRTSFPADPYFVNGGVTERPGPSFYDLWNVSRDQ